jgi:hypothetical protein
MTFNNTQEEIDGLRRLIEQVVEEKIGRAGGGLPFRSSISSTYAGGDPITKAVGDSAAAGEGHAVLQSYGYTLPRASDPVMEFPMGGSTLVAPIGDLHDGILTEGAYWLIPSYWPTVEGTFGVTSKAVRLICPLPLRVASGHIVVANGVASATGRFRFYTSRGSSLGSLILDTGDIDCASNGVKSVTLGSPVDLHPGAAYAIHYTSNNASMTLRSSPLSTNGDDALNAGTTQQAADATFATPSGTTDFPWIKLQG